MGGVLNVNKPQEMTSHDVVAILRRATGIKRIGHTGTLDPMATGVLPICIGSATRIMEYLDLDLKAYDCQLQLGTMTDTLDIWGKTLETRSFAGVTEADIQEALTSFRGRIDQKPPMYSAVKVNGRKLYEYARAGQQVDVKSRPVYIKTLEQTGWDPARGVLSLTIVCTKGTYIRTICQDLGEKLGCGAVMTSLTRTASGALDLDRAIDLETLREMDPDAIARHLISPDLLLTAFGRGTVGEEAAWRLTAGQVLTARDWQAEETPQYAQKEFYLPLREALRRAYCMYGPDGQFLAVAFAEPGGRLKADKVFRSIE